MTKIGLLSDTHAWWDRNISSVTEECDEIWHAGDIGSDDVAARLSAIKPFRAVYGNADGQSLRLQYPEIAHFDRKSKRDDDAYRWISWAL